MRTVARHPHDHVLLLSAAGMHALMSFAIAQQTREIGIRSAPGAQPRHLLWGIFGRAMRRLSIGLATGSVLATAAFSAAGIGFGPGAALLITVAAITAVVGALAALGPARKSFACDCRRAARRRLTAVRRHDCRSGTVTAGSTKLIWQVQESRKERLLLAAPTLARL